MVGLQTLDLAIGVRVPASQPKELGRASIDDSPILLLDRIDFKAAYRPLHPSLQTVRVVKPRHRVSDRLRQR